MAHVATRLALALLLAFVTACSGMPAQPSEATGSGSSAAPPVSADLAATYADASDAPPVASPASSSTGSLSIATAGSAGGGTVELPPIRLVASQPGQNLPIVAKGCPEVSVGQWSMKACVSDRIAVNVD